MRSDFDYSNLFQSEKQHSVNIQHQSKSKLARPVCTVYGAMNSAKNSAFIEL